MSQHRPNLEQNQHKSETPSVIPAKRSAIGNKVPTTLMNGSGQHGPV
jgi:hypothetical protein